MGKTKTSKRQKKSLKGNFNHLPIFKTSEGLENHKEILEALIECLKQNDLESFEDILVAHLRIVSKSQFRKKSGLGRQTLYDLIQGRREFNPTLKTIGGLFKALAA
jgi:DNA-binding phage protein